MTTPSNPSGDDVRPPSGPAAGEPETPGREDQATPRHLDESAAWDEAAVVAREAHEMDSTAVRRRSLMGLDDPAAERPPAAAAAAGAPAGPGAAAPGPGDASTTPAAAPENPEDPRSAALRARMREEADRPGTVLDGATEVRPVTRTGAHVRGVVITLLLTPVAWYLWADAGARLALVPGSPWETGNLNVAALVELAAALLVTVAVLLAARWSSVGAILTGSLVLLGGLAFVAFPLQVRDAVEPVLERAADLGGIGVNLRHHLPADGSTGRLVLYGVGLVLLGVVSHGARRQGRAEERTRTEASGRPPAPGGAGRPRHASRRERRA